MLAYVRIIFTLSLSLSLIVNTIQLMIGVTTSCRDAPYGCTPRAASLVRSDNDNSLPAYGVETSAVPRLIEVPVDSVVLDVPEDLNYVKQNKQT